MSASSDIHTNVDSVHVHVTCGTWVMGIDWWYM